MPDTNICQYYPRWFREILDFQSLCYTEKQVLNAIAEAMAQIRENLFVQTMDEGTTAQWERILRILHTPGETLAFRRLRVLNRLALRPPFTLNFLRQKLDAIFGPGNWEVDMDYPSYTLEVEMFARTPEQFAGVDAFLDVLGIVKPCHIVYRAALTAPEMDSSVYITPCLGRCMSVTYLPELARPASSGTAEEVFP